MRENRLERLDPALYALSAAELAPALLGRTLVRVVDGVRLVGEIVETEAYLGPEDAAAHSRGGNRSRRNASMWLGGGHAYVYFVYGMHHCMNVVAGPRDSGAAVLIRAVRPIDGVDTMLRHRGLARPTLPAIGSGPARLAQALAIDRELDGEDLRTSARLWIEEGSPTATWRSTERIGVDYAGAWAQAALRFLKNGAERWQSRPSRRS